MVNTRRQFLRLAGTAALGASIGSSLLRLQAGSAEAQPIPGGPTLRGTAGRTVAGPVSLAAGLVVLRGQHNGTGGFYANLFLSTSGDPPETEYELAEFDETSIVYDLTGPVKCGAAALLGIPGDHYLAVLASGAWQASFEQPLPGNVSPVQQSSFTGKGQDISPYFTLPDGITTITATTTNQSAEIWLYHLDDLGGAPVQAGLQLRDGSIFDFSRSANQGSYPISLPDSGPYLLFVQLHGASTDPWTVTFS